ncbi:uncharacterized protein [Amphiura filiformis]|uniref:uncharacterized protein isoform X1 n=1 Tax=Amphiura filiformis TaxID=82378 RepID=UPI003B228089
MSLFCPGISWGRRRKALTRGASQRRRNKTVSRGISTTDLTSSVGSQPACGCVSRKKDEKHTNAKNNNEFGGVYLGKENNNNGPISSSAGIESIVYHYEDSFCAQHGSSANTLRSDTPYQPTPEPPDRTEPLEQHHQVFIPNWVRNQRYLPTIDDVDFDQIDAISLHSLAAATTERTPERLKSLMSDMDSSIRPNLSPIYQNLVDQELSDLYLQAQMNRLYYSSTPLPSHLVNVANPQVMTAASEAAHGAGFTQAHLMQPESMRRDSVSLSSTDVSKTMNTPTKLSSPKSRTPLKQLNFNTPAFPRVTPRAARHRQESVASIYDNVPQNAKENQPAIGQRSATSAKKRPQRQSEAIARKKSDLRKKALMRNFSYKPIQEQDIDEAFTNNNRPVNCENRDAAAGMRSSDDMSEILSTSRKYSQQNSLSPKTLNKFPNEDFLEAFEKLTVDDEIIMPSCDTDEVPSHHGLETGNKPQQRTRRRTGGSVVRKPEYAANAPRQARVVSISRSPSSECSSSDNDGEASQPVTSTKVTNETELAPSIDPYKRSWSFAGSRPNMNPSQYVNPMQDNNVPQFRRTSATNIRNVQNRLSFQPKGKIKNTPLRPRQIDVIPEEVEPGDIETISPPFTPSVTDRKIHCRNMKKEPCGHGFALFNFVERSEGDISIKKGELVTVLNMDDEEWIFVQLGDGLGDGLNTEGFVPRSYVFISPLKGAPVPSAVVSQPAESSDEIEMQADYHAYENLPAKQTRGEIKPTTKKGRDTLSRKASYKRAQLNNRRVEKNRRNGPSDRYMTLVETYVIIQDHVAEEMDEVNVKTGELVFVNSKQQRENQVDWMWVLVPGSGRTGYIPAFSARPVDFQSSRV